MLALASVNMECAGCCAACHAGWWLSARRFAVLCLSHLGLQVEGPPVVPVLGCCTRCRATSPIWMRQAGVQAPLV